MCSWKTAISLALIFSSLLLADNQKISELTAVTQLDKDDLLLVSEDDGDGTYTSKKLTLLDYATVRDVRLYGAKGDGVTDDTTAIQAAIDATPAGGRCFLPAGKYRITDTLTRTTPIEFCGVGPASIIIPDIDASTNALHFGSPSAGTYEMKVHDFTIASTSSQHCLNALVMERTYDSLVDNVNVVADHANAGLLLAGATCTRVRHFSTGYSAVTGITYTRGAVGIEIADSTVQSNALQIDCFVNLMTDTGIKATSSMATNNIRITGTVQSCTNYGLYFDGLWLVELDNLYTEVVAENHFENCTDLSFKNFKHYQTGETSYWIDCEGVLVQDSVFRNIDIDGDCYGFKFQNVHVFGTRTGDGLYRVRTGEGIQNGSSQFSGVGIISDGDSTNYCQNTDFTYWTSTNPEGWSQPAAVTWTRSGVGLADTEHCITDNAAKAVFTSYSSSTHTLWDTSSAVNALIQAGTGSFSIWCKVSGTPTNYPSVRIRVVDGSGNNDYYTQTMTASDTGWTHLTRTFPVTASTTDVQVALYCYGTCYIACPVLQASYSASRSWTTSPFDFTSNPTSPRVYNVLAYGAKGDGTTDDTAAIQAVEAIADDAGGIVYFPPGDYDLNASLTVSSNVVFSFSAGAKVSVGDTYTLTFANSAQIVSPFGNDCFDLEGSGAVAYTSQAGIFSQAWTDGIVDNFGINTIDPNTALDVEGTITANALIVDHGMSVGGGSTSAGFIDIYEDSDNGTSKLTVIAPSAMSADAVATFPETTGTVGVWLSGSVTWDPGDLADGAGETSAGITVTGAALGDFVLVSAPYDLQDLICTGYVQAANTVEIRIQNENAGASVNLASGTWRVRVMKQ